MIENSVELSKIDWKRTFPWVRLFRVFHTAIDLRMLLLGSVGIALLVCGDTVLSHLPFAPTRDKIDVTFDWNERPQAADPRAVPEGLLQNPWRGLIIAGGGLGRGAAARADGGDSSAHDSASRRHLEPEDVCVDAAVVGTLCLGGRRRGDVPHRGSRADPRYQDHSSIGPLVFVDEFPLLHDGDALARRRYRHLLGPVLIGGFLGWLPVVGPPLLGLLWGLELLFGFVMALDLDRRGSRLAVDVRDDQHRRQRRI